MNVSLFQWPITTATVFESALRFELMLLMKSVPLQRDLDVWCMIASSPSDSCESGSRAEGRNNGHFSEGDITVSELSAQLNSGYSPRSPWLELGQDNLGLVFLAVPHRRQSLHSRSRDWAEEGSRYLSATLTLCVASASSNCGQDEKCRHAMVLILHHGIVLCLRAGVQRTLCPWHQSEVEILSCLAVMGKGGSKIVVYRHH